MRRRDGGGRPTWFELRAEVGTSVVSDVRDSNVPDGDAIFATACTTAAPVLRLSARKGSKLYLVQGYEDWACGEEGVIATWRMPLHKVVSSEWLREMALELGEGGRATHIPYGVELDVFRLDVAPAERNPFRVGMLYHPLPSKGVAYGVEALESLKESFLDLQPVAFGAYPRPESLPLWIDYVESPPRRDLVALYNSLAVFLHTSVTEGWGLTGAEAIACGCALVAADSGGIRDYAIDRETALLAPARDAPALAARTAELMRNNTLRTRIAVRGHDAIQDFTWSRAAERLERVIYCHARPDMRGDPLLTPGL